MGCKKIKQLISPYLDGELSPDEMQRVQTHLANCRECQKEYENILSISASLKRIGRDVLPAPAGFTDLVMHCLNGETAVCEPKKPFLAVKHLRNLVAGIAAAAVMVFFATNWTWTPVLHVAEKTPAETPPFINDLLEPGGKTSHIIDNNTVIPKSNDEPIPPDEGVANTASPPNAGGPDIATEPVKEHYQPDVTLLNTVPVIKSTMLHLRVEDSAITLARVSDVAAENIKTIQQANNDGTTIVRITAPIAEAKNLAKTFGSMGEILSNQEDEKDAAESYSNTLEQYQVLIGKYNDSLPEEQNQLLKQIKSLEDQLANWQNESQQQTIVLVIQQK